MKNTERNELAVCGFAAVKTLEKNGWEKIRRFYFSKERAPLFGGLCKKLAAAKRPYNQVRDVQELERLCGSVHHQGVVAMIEMPDIPALNTDDTDRWIRNRESAVLLDRVGNANNLGAIVRSAAFFGVRNIVIPLDEAQSSVTTSSYRVAEGGMEFVNIYTIRSISKLLSGMEGRMVRIGTSLDARESVAAIGNYCRDKGSIIVLGNEESGISDEVKRNCDHLLLIPYAGIGRGRTAPKVDSLNVAQASAVVMYELAKVMPIGG
ncbi:MAG: RNA methyltransferase [Treponema sp.]|nr:RNA methyltransferase [Treponema sp.]MBQ7166006.1 RNA methyltransferase [Treponema sp.]